MGTRTRNKKRLQETLDQITSAGIQADRQQLKKDMCAQFSNYREWIREYVVNAYDAMASHCRISGEKQGDEITITVQDDGKGMNEQRIKKFFTLYASEKDMEANRAIGTHGIGKLSIAAIPDQTRFEMQTSDGKDAWMVKSGRLDGTEDIRVRALNANIPRGTTFRITFKSDHSLMKELTLLKEILFLYVRFLPMHISISIPMNEQEEATHIMESINENWDTYSDSFSRKYTLDIQGASYEVHLNLGEPVHEIYQKKVLVSSKYNLLSHGLKKDWVLGYLAIRVNSSAFELPFGRHCLRDEDILKPLAGKIRNQLLPQYMSDLYQHTQQIPVDELRAYAYDVDSLTCHLISLDPSLNKPWCSWEFIRTLKLGKLSFKELVEIVKTKGRFFIEDESNAGIDYSNFSEPVLQNEQVGDLTTLLKVLFKERCVFLKSTDLVFEKHGVNQLELNELQKTFEKNLGFHRDLISSEEILNETDEKPEVKGSVEDISLVGQGMFSEVEEACQDLSTLNWKVSFLVEKDFKTPCLTHLFIYTNHTIILNLYHPLVEKLVALSAVNPGLAGHWGVSLCLEDSRNVFPYLSADTRKELLMLDGIAKLAEPKSSNMQEQELKAFNQTFKEFRRNLNDSLKKNLN
jgi:hypothetical protein